MAEKVPQTYANHTRLDPPFHLFLLPVAGISLVLAIWGLISNPGGASAWGLVAAAAALTAVFKIRLYALRVQDRVIRLEERLRLATLLPEALRSRMGELSEAQFVALRFAADEDVAALVEKTLANGWKNAEIKKAIGRWRPDYFRV